MNSFSWPIRVYYEDTDSGGVVYYANYLKFMERARTEWLRKLGFEQDELARQQELIFMVRSAKLDYHRPARFNDLLEVHSAVTDVRRVSLSFEQHVRKAATAKTEGDELLCRGHIQIACLAATTLRPKPIPTALLTQLGQ